LGASYLVFFAGYTYWFPKFTGFKLNETLGKYAFWCWFFGFLLAFLPLYILGLMGATRRLNHYDVVEWQPLFIVAAMGLVLILCGLGFQLLQLYVSIKQRKENRDTTGDPWNGRNLEWSTSSPPPFYNYAIIPEVHERDPFWAMKQSKVSESEKPIYQDIHMPKNTSLGFYIGAFSFVLGFGMVWHMFWLAGLSFLGILACIVIRLSQKDTDYYVPAKEVEEIETRRMRA